jgi:hypothetical protein
MRFFVTIPIMEIVVALVVSVVKVRTIASITAL